MQVLYLLLLLGAGVCFVLAAIGVKTTRPIDFIALGLALWVTVEIIQMAQRV